VLCKDGLAMETTSKTPVSASVPASNLKVVGQAALTGVIVAGPLVALVVEIVLLWGRAVHLRDLLLAGGLFLVTGHGVTVGFHRLFTHRSFKPNRALKIVLAVAGSMAVEGSVLGWVANHRRHHMFSDRSGDPHSPYVKGGARLGLVRGFLHAHLGWLFTADDTVAQRFAPDLLRDRDVVVISKLFPLLALASLALPFGLGWALSGGTVAGALTALIWAGLVRMTVLHHVTWSVNSVCHLFGRQPFAVKDQSRNFAPLAVLSMGESWHNFHHAFPSAARHGALRGQLDSSAAFIKLCERAGWATKVRWPTPGQIAAARAVAA
jgi:stearoyl-CoA desaturase (delta-9 desaturase)